MKYRVHQFDIKMTKDQGKLEQFLNSLEGEVKAIIPNVTVSFFGFIRWTFFSLWRRLPKLNGLNPSWEKDF